MKKLLIILPVIMLLAMGCNTYQQANKTDNPNTQTTTQGYKPFNKLGYFTAEIPSDWSTLYNSENILQKNQQGEYEIAPRNSIAAIAKNDISFSDTSWNQVDFYAAESNITDNIKKQFNTGGSWKKETINNYTADVFTFDLDNGQVTKGGTGGKIYLFHLPKNYLKTFIIHKQALGDQTFEDDFKHLLTTSKFEF
jgi:hypothetical protein